MKRPAVLVFAGSDPGGGAGLQADMQAIGALGCHALTVVTALTVQDNDRVFEIHPVSAQLVQRQEQVLLDKIDVVAVKIGIVGSRANADIIAGIVQQLQVLRPDLPVVLDPVLASGHGDALSVDDAVQAIAPLIPLALLMTPNLPETLALCGGERRLDLQMMALLQLGCRHVLIKGGHGTDDKVTNRWFTRGASQTWYWPRLAGAFHGSGCTLASAVATLLAQGKDMAEALGAAQLYCHQTLEFSYAIAEGQRIPDRLLSSLRESA
jgi:hydroxymethylpyrimidine/phosphomethylpyrimidine kinase